MTRYKISDITIKNGFKRDIHHRMECSMYCELLDLRTGLSAVIRYYMVGLNPKIAATSPVEKIQYDDDTIVIHTKNTIYTLKEIEGLC